MSIVIEDGSGVSGANSYSEESELTEYLDTQGMSITDDFSKEHLLIQAFKFMQTLDLCEITTNLIKVKSGQNEIARQLGNGFDLYSESDGKYTTKEGLGKGALVDEFEIINKDLIGNDSISKLRRMGFAYDVLKDVICTPSLALLHN